MAPSVASLGERWIEALYKGVSGGKAATGQCSAQGCNWAGCIVIPAPEGRAARAGHQRLEKRSAGSARQNCAGGSLGRMRPTSLSSSPSSSLQEFPLATYKAMAEGKVSPSMQSQQVSPPSQGQDLWGTLLKSGGAWMSVVRRFGPTVACQLHCAFLPRRPSV